MMIRTGDLLVAPPQMKDSRFSESVIIMVHAGRDGHWGLCLNKGLGLTVADMLTQADITVALQSEMFWGGPVNQGVIWLLHDSDWSMPATQALNSDWSMTSHRSMFEHIDVQGEPDHWRMFSGFAAWGPGQLEAEIQGDYPWTAGSSWLTCQGFDPKWAFAQGQQHLWNNAIALCSQQTVSSWF